DPFPRRGADRDRPVRAAARPLGPGALGGRLARGDLRQGGDGARAGPRPDARPGRLVLAHRGAGEPRAGVRRRGRGGHLRALGELRCAVRPGPDGGDGDPCVVDPAGGRHRRALPGLGGPAVHDRGPASPAGRSGRAAGTATVSTSPPADPPVEPTTPDEEVRLLTEPRDGIPDVVDDGSALAEAVDAVRSGRGPVAIDAERASGYRYGQRAYLVQVRREGAGTWLIDPVPLEDLSGLGQALDGTEWVLHAATQDLPCLAEVGLRPSNLFDTELGARLAGLPRVGLAAVVEHYLKVSLAKEHSAVDWSTRPLPEPWLRYAALDVELLVELREAVAEDLQQQGKLEW